ncbi:MAG: L-threonylcarbamoyladenylate synthase [Thermoleophilia bacterium]|nr:L-threonylcarbamoyladenylate synthase [Thermoleophilia bacterium]
MTEILRQQEMKPSDWERLSASLNRGELAVLPSDTVYGLGCLATIPRAIERIYEVKRREQKKPVALVFTGAEQILTLVPELPETISSALGRLLPGPITAIIPFDEGTGGIRVHGGGSIGVRIIPPPAGDIYLNLPGPLAITSANLSGQADAAAIEQIPDEVLDTCGFVLDNGSCGQAIPSTVVDLRPLAEGGTPAILRQGSMDLMEILERLGS